MPQPPVRVLLVDDDEDEYVVLGGLLPADERFHLTWAPTYKRGLEAILEAHCDVALVDYRLGEHSGLDLLAEIAAVPNHPQIILLTGKGDYGVDAAATNAGAADYLVKDDLTSAALERSIRFALERGRILKTPKELAHSLMLAKSAFVTAVSHEIRTPMNAILGMADMLWESPLNPEQRQYVEVFRRAGAGLLLLINDILDLSKIEAGHIELERVPFDLEDAVDQAVELTAVKARVKGIALLVHFSPGTPTSVMGDPARLRQVLINLLGNAVKFTQLGHVMLSVRSPDRGKPGVIEFAITDTGIGIAPDKLEMIFDDFTQADASTTRKYGGTGLGLAISRRLAQAMGGTLTATSLEGLGSTFRFALPYDPSEKPPKTPAVVPDFLGKRVLLIDDNATDCFILQETLSTWGLQSATFSLPAEALAGLPEAMAGEHPYSLVILARAIPGMDSFECAAEIKRIAGTLPVIILTSDTRPEDLARYAKAGLSGYAVKPVSRTQLFALVKEALQGHQVTQPHLAGSVALQQRESVRPARILIAEDSPDNRLLIRVYLKDSPYELTFEEDGKAAVDRFATSDFDLVLMDVQMPVMDGLAATIAIRVLEKRRESPPISIVALTASASAQDILNSGNAGCNAHLSKPISKSDLLSAIEKYRPQPAPDEMTSSESQDPVMIEMPSGLENIVPWYLARRRKEVSEMMALLSASDFGRLAQLSHDLKGTGNSYGFSELTRLGAALEQAAKQADRGTLREQVTELGNYLNRVQLVAQM